MITLFADAGRVPCAISEIALYTIARDLLFSDSGQSRDHACQSGSIKYTRDLRERVRGNRTSCIVFCLFARYLPLSAKMQRVFTRKVRFDDILRGKNKKKQFKIVELDRLTNRDLI